jgi:hypothetical protein
VPRWTARRDRAQPSQDPELASVLPGWGEPLSFDAEDGPALLGQVFDIVEIQRRDAPVVRIPDLYLRGRGLAEASPALMKSPTADSGI